MTNTKQAVGPIRSATIVVPDLDESVRLYVDGLGWQQRAMVPEPFDGPDGPLGARQAWVGPGDSAASSAGVHLVEVVGATPVEPLHTHGWSAIEISVLDVKAATARAAAAGWRVLFEPVVLGGGKFPLVAAQLAGPSGEGVYITEIRGELPGFELPDPVEEVDGIFMVVLGSSELERSRGIIEERFDVRRASDRELPVRVVNAQFGFPADRLHRISSVQLRGRNCIEVDQLPDEARPRQRASSAGILAIMVDGDAAEWVELGDGALLRIEPTA